MADAQPQTVLTTQLRVRRVLGILLQVTLVAILLFIIFLAYGTINNRWYRTVVITGGSMAPTINYGDAIIITRPPQVLQPGMVVTMQVNDRVVTHRIIEVQSDGSFVTQGDANQVADSWESADVRVVGVYRFRVPRVGYISIYAQRLASVFRPSPIQVEWQPAG